MTRFAVLVTEGGYLCSTFSAGKPWAKRIAYRALFPFARPLIRKANGVYPENVEQSLQIVRETLDELTAETSAGEYLVGDVFSVADLAAASLLMPLANIDHADTRRLEPMPAAVAEFLKQFKEHAAIDWLRHIYAKHRRVLAAEQ